MCLFADHIVIIHFLETGKANKNSIVEKFIRSTQLVAAPSLTHHQLQRDLPPHHPSQTQGCFQARDPLGASVDAHDPRFGEGG